MTAQYTTSFVDTRFRAALRTYYIRDLQMRAYDSRVSYYYEKYLHGTRERGSTHKVNIV